MYKRGFTLIELIMALFIISATCCVTSASYLFSVKQRRQSGEIHHNLNLCIAILDCLKSRGSGEIKNIYDLSPRSPKGEASWYICFDNVDEIKSIINDIDCFPEYCAFSNITSEANGKRYTAFISISIRKDSSTSFTEYPVKIQLIDSKHGSKIPLCIDYEFLSDL